MVNVCDTPKPTVVIDKALPYFVTGQKVFVAYSFTKIIIKIKVLSANFK